MTLAGTLVAIGVSTQLARTMRRYKKDKKMALHFKRKLPIVPRFVHELLACLTDVVYARDNGISPEIHCEHLGYKAIDELVLSAYGDEFLRCIVFERDGLGSNSCALRLRVVDKSGKEQFEEVPSRKYVVAVRGTIPSRVTDIRDDLRLIIERVCERKKFYEPLMQLLSELHRHAGKDEVWVTGHSLGAATILVATRRLADEQGIVLATHLFNPPNLSADLGLKKLAIGTAKGLGSGAGKVPVAGHLMKPAIEAFASLVINVTEKSGRMVGKALAPDTYERAAKRNEKLLKTGFCPHLYVNPRDFVCNEYIQHFRPHLRRGPSPVSTSVLFTQFFLSLGDGKESGHGSCHLIPQAVVHVNNWATGPWHAHKLTQWYRYDPVNFTSRHAG